MGVLKHIKENGREQKKIISDQDIFLYKCQHIVACKKSGHNIWDKVYV